jgi:hypothetical protein
MTKHKSNASKNITIDVKVNPNGHKTHNKTKNYGHNKGKGKNKNFKETSALFSKIKSLLRENFPKHSENSKPPKLQFPEITNPSTCNIQKGLTLPGGGQNVTWDLQTANITITGYNTNNFSMALSPANPNYFMATSTGSAVTTQPNQYSQNKTFQSGTSFRVIGAEMIVSLSTAASNCSGTISIGTVISSNLTDQTNLPLTYANLVKCDNRAITRTVSSLAGKSVHFVCGLLGTTSTLQTELDTTDKSSGKRPSLVIIGEAITGADVTSVNEETLSFVNRIKVNGHYVDKNRVFDINRNELNMTNTAAIVSMFNNLAPIEELGAQVNLSSLLTVQMNILYETTRGIYNSTQPNINSTTTHRCYTNLDMISNYIQKHYWRIQKTPISLPATAVMAK